MKYLRAFTEWVKFEKTMNKLDIILGPGHKKISIAVLRIGESLPREVRCEFYSNIRSGVHSGIKIPIIAGVALTKALESIQEKDKV